MSSRCLGWRLGWVGQGDGGEVSFFFGSIWKEGGGRRWGIRRLIEDGFVPAMRTMVCDCLAIVRCLSEIQ